MLADHIAWTFVPTESVLAFGMHLFGRLTAPIMCFFIAEGYVHTTNLRKYFIRMAVFSVISGWAYGFYESGGKLGYHGFGMIYTLFLGLIAIHVWNQKQLMTGLRIVLIVILCFFSLLGDWPIMGILWPLFFYIYRDDNHKKYVSFSIVGVLEASSFIFMYWGDWSMVIAMLCQFGVLLAIPVLSCYNGQLGKYKGMKWLFYIFYPAHLIAITLIRIMII
jgi:hypothetical protein